MASVKNTVRDKARALRQQGKAIKEIAAELDVDRNVVSRWVKDIELTEEQKCALEQKYERWRQQVKGSETNRRKAHDKRIAYQEMGRKQAQNGSSLHLMGCMLYWAEGAKNRTSTQLVNIDAQMLLLFRNFLVEEMQVLPSDITMFILCNTEDEAIQTQIGKYWLATLHLPSQCLLTVKYKKDSKVDPSEINNGICTLRIHDVELTMKIFGAIQEYIGIDKPTWLFD